VCTIIVAVGVDALICMITSLPHAAAGQQSQPPQQKKAKLFISYRREEISIDFAKRLHGDLKGKGWEVFLDSMSIKVGDPISEKISDAIRNCHGMIIIFSGEYVGSEWCKKEMLQAVSSGKKKLYPIRRQKIEYPDLLKYHVGDLRWVDIFNDDQYTVGLAELVAALELVCMSGVFITFKTLFLFFSSWSTA